VKSDNSSIADETGQVINGYPGVPIQDSTPEHLPAQQPSERSNGNNYFASRETMAI
jgi:hypothetical protein